MKTFWQTGLLMCAVILAPGFGYTEPEPCPKPPCTDPLFPSTQYAEKALYNAREAVEHGKQGHADAMVRWAGKALKDAEAAQKIMDDPNLIEGVKDLKTAVEYGNAGHADYATKAVEGAVEHLSKIK